MNPDLTPTPFDSDASAEISSLIETLLSCEQRLEELTAGEVDSVTDHHGRTVLLRRAQEQVRLGEVLKHEAADVTLHRQHTELRALFDLMPAMIWFKDTENRILRVNQRVAEALGKPVDEIEGKPALEVYPQETAQRHTDDLAVIRSGTPQLGVIESVRTSDGAERWLQTDKMPVRDKNGVVTGIVVITRDITAQKWTEESLRLLGSAVEQSKEAILITDAELNSPGPHIIFVNPAFEQMTGYTAAEAIGKTPRILQGPHTDRAVLKRLRKTLEEGGVFQGEAINYRKDGVEFDLEWQIAPMRDTDGKVTHYVCIQRDITARKNSEDALRKSEKRFKALFDQAAVGVAQTDAETGSVMQINRRFCEIVGRDLEEMKHLTFASISHPDDLARSVDMLQQLKSGKIREFTHEKRYLKKTGGAIWANVTISAMWAPGDKPDYFLVVGQDVTERKRLEDQIRQSQKMEAIGTLAGGIAHDFNNILAAINGYTELSLMALEGNTQVRSHLGAVMQAASRATNLVRQILTFSRQQPLERRPIQLLPIMTEALMLLRATIPSTIEFDTSLPSNAPTVLADATQVHQILMNLGTNAWHAMKDRPGRLKVTLERWVVDAAQASTQTRLLPGVYARVSVSDTGRGMDPATLRRIFEPFFTTKAPGEGTGLGLAVVHGIMDVHDGAITVQSQPGEGTTFHLYFPAHATEETLHVLEKGLAPHGNGERILFVDDEALLAQLGQQALISLGYTVEITTEPTTALDWVRADPHRFSLVITDQTMPHMTGLLLADEIHSIRPDLPIILTTGYSHSLTAEGVGAQGICQLLLKPFTIRSLGDAAHNALAPARQR